MFIYFKTVRYVFPRDGIVFRWERIAIKVRGQILSSPTVCKRKKKKKRKKDSVVYTKQFDSTFRRCETLWSINLGERSRIILPDDINGSLSLATFETAGVYKIPMIGTIVSVSVRGTTISVSTRTKNNGCCFFNTIATIRQRRI